MCHCMIDLDPSKIYQDQFKVDFGHFTVELCHNEAVLGKPWLSKVKFREQVLRAIVDKKDQSLQFYLVIMVVNVTFLIF